MQGLSWQHVAVIFLGVILCLGAAFTPASGALIPVGASMITGSLAHAAPARTRKEGWQDARIK